LQEKVGVPAEVWQDIIRRLWGWGTCRRACRCV